MSFVLRKYRGDAGHFAGEMVDRAVSFDDLHEEQSDDHSAMEAAVSVCQGCLHATPQHLHRCIVPATSLPELTACLLCMSQYCMHFFLEVRASAHPVTCRLPLHDTQLTTDKRICMCRSIDPRESQGSHPEADPHPAALLCARGCPGDLGLLQAQAADSAP